MNLDPTLVRVARLRGMRGEIRADEQVQTGGGQAMLKVKRADRSERSGGESDFLAQLPICSVFRCLSRRHAAAGKLIEPCVRDVGILPLDQNPALGIYRDHADGIDSVCYFVG